MCISSPLSLQRYREESGTAPFSAEDYDAADAVFQARLAAYKAANRKCGPCVNTRTLIADLLERSGCPRVYDVWKPTGLKAEHYRATLEQFWNAAAVNPCERPAGVPCGLA